MTPSEERRWNRILEKLTEAERESARFIRVETTNRRRPAILFGTLAWTFSKAELILGIEGSA